MAVDVGICCGSGATLSDRDAREHAWEHAHCSSESWNGTKAGRASTGVGKSVCSESASDVDSSELDEGWRRLDAVMALVRRERSGTTGVDWAASGVIAARGTGWPDGMELAAARGVRRRSSASPQLGRKFGVVNAVSHDNYVVF